MNVHDVFPSKFVKSHDLGSKLITVTIRSITLEDMGFGTEKETKPVLWFEKATKGLVLNRTNAMIIASIYGPEMDNWIGESITIYSARVKAFGSWHDAVRVKEQRPARNMGAAKIPDAMQEAPPIDDEDDLLDVDEGQEAPRVDQATGEIVQPTDVDFGMGQATQTPVAASNGAEGINPFDDESDGSPPHQRLWGIGMAVLGPDWDMARPWIIKQWTKLESPDNVRKSLKELSDDEKSQLGDYLNANASTVQKLWPKQRAIIEKATEQEPVKEAA